MSTLPDDERELLDWLYGTQLFGVKLGLDNMRKLLRALDLERPRARILHVAGTNGKGSTCAFAHALLSAAGFRTGLFTSPHLVHFRERIRDSEREIDSAELVAILHTLRETVSAWAPHPTFFELALAAALMWFRDQKVEWIVLETGLGGRLDATNTLSPEACIITRIGLDHTDVLGPTLADIAAEKAGIIKPGVPIVTGPQEPDAMTVIESTARKQNTPLHRVESPCAHSPLGIPGRHSAWNAALALRALEVTGVTLSPDKVEKALAETRWPGRFQRLGPDDSIVLDGSHNPDAIDALVETWREFYPNEKTALVYGGVAGKDHAENLHRLAPIVAEWHLTPLKSPRTLTPAQIHELLPPSAPPVSVHDSLAEAIEAARHSKHRVLIAGSLYLVGEALALLQPDQAFEPSAQ